MGHDPLNMAGLIWPIFSIYGLSETRRQLLRDQRTEARSEQAFLIEHSRSIKATSRAQVRVIAYIGKWLRVLAD